MRLGIPLLSKPGMDEYRAVLGGARAVEKFKELKPEAVGGGVLRLMFVGDYVRFPRLKFPFERDVRDQMFLEVAIELRATHIISHDDDLLTLPRSRTEAGRRFRQRLRDVQVVTAAEFVDEYAGRL